MLDQNTMTAGFIRLKVIHLLGKFNTTIKGFNKRTRSESVCVCVSVLWHNWPPKYWRSLLTLLDFFFSFFFFFTKMKHHSKQKQIFRVRSFKCVINLDTPYLFFVFLLLFFPVCCLFVSLFVTSTQQLLSVLCKFFLPFLKATVNIFEKNYSSTILLIVHMQLDIHPNMKICRTV